MPDADGETLILKELWPAAQTISNFGEKILA